LAAWRGLELFDRRSSLRTWLYRIATNRCLNALRDKGRRPREVEAITRPAAVSVSQDRRHESTGEAAGTAYLSA
jgi:DNA-directed RNA polymerase specialized sigma24 family protein